MKTIVGGSLPHSGPTAGNLVNVEGLMTHSREIICGLETEYGLLVEGSGADRQVHHSAALVRAFPDAALADGWDYEFESPRSDLRGFRVERLSVDPVDQQFDTAEEVGSPDSGYADRILPNGARFYNDHGHPEYATPECRSLHDLAAHDLAGEVAVHRAGEAYAGQIGREVTLYKNNTDFHGASFGSHESYLIPRELVAGPAFGRLYRFLAPLFAARVILVGAGKVGSEAGRRVAYQMSQRAEHFSVDASVDTLFRRPLFNTRDEPHADGTQWARLHVICTDANRVPAANMRKVGLVKMALLLALSGAEPPIGFADPVRSYEALSKGERDLPRDGGGRTTAAEVLESYFAAAERHLDLDNDSEIRWTVDSSRSLLKAMSADPPAAAREVEWMLKEEMLRRVAQASSDPLDQAEMQSYDLAYSDINPEASLFPALSSMGLTDAAVPDPRLLTRAPANTRAAVRGWAVASLGEALAAACWRSLTVAAPGGFRRLELAPDGHYEVGMIAANGGVEGLITLLTSHGARK